MMIPKIGRTLPTDCTSKTKPETPQGSCLRRRGAQGRTGIRALLIALLCVFTAAAAGAQSAILNGQLTSFGSSLVGAAAIAVDGSQNAYVLLSTGAVYKETLNSTSGQYTENLLFTTKSGTGLGIAVDKAGSNIFVATLGAVTPYTGSGTSYTGGTSFSGFTGITAVAVDSSGNVYITDAAAGTLTKETLSGTSYSAAQIASSLGVPMYVAVNAGGTVFVYSTVSAANGNFYKIAGSGTTYTSANLGITGFTGVTGLAADSSSNLYVPGANSAVGTGSYVFKATLSGGAYTTAPYYEVGGAVALDAKGNVYLVSSGQSAVTKFSLGNGFLDFGSVGPGAPAVLTVAFTVTDGTSTSTLMNTPTVVTQGLTGYDYSLGSGTTCSSTTYATTAKSCKVVVNFSPQASGSRLGAVSFLVGGKVLASSYLGGIGFTPLAAYQSVTLLNTIACPSSKCSSSLPNGLSNGRGITVDPAGNVWVANSTAGTILKFPAGSQTPVTFNASNTCSPVGTAIDGQGNVFFTCNGEMNMYELVNGAGTPVKIPVGYYTDDHLSVDAAGNLYPTSYSPGNKFLKVAAGTHAVTVLATAPDGSVGQARFVGAVTDAAGNTFAPDYNNNILYELAAGTSTPTVLFSGPPLQSPHAIAEDAAGSLYVTTTVPNTTGDGNSPLLRFSAGSYTSAPAQLSVPGGDSLYITPDGDFYTVYSNTTLQVYTRTKFALTYPSTAVGQTSPSQTVTLENDGTAPLTISPPSTGKNPSLSSNFTYDPASTCPQLSLNSAAITLAAGSSCTQIIEFMPQQAGAISGSVVTTDNSANVSGSTQTINMSGTATQGTPTFTVSNATGTLGQNATITATVTGGGVTPAGVVKFTVGTGASVTATCSGSTNSETCTATYPTSSGVNAGANTITATLAADTNYLASSATGTLTLAAAPTTSTVTSGTNPSTFGNSVTFTGTVTSSYGTPTGSITFYDGTTALGTASLTAGVGTFSTSTLLGGTHSITIGYALTGNFDQSTSAPVTQTVKTTSNYTNSLASSSMTPSFGSTVTFTDTLSTVNGVVPTGIVEFYSGATKLGSASVTPAGTASFNTSTLPVGTESITAKYLGDTNYTVSTSAAVQEVVGPASVLSALATSNANPTYGGSVTLTESLPILANTPATGTVTFYSGTTVLGKVNVDPSGNTQLVTTALLAGTDTLKAVYNGDGNYNPSTSNPVTENVAKANVPTFTLASSNTTPVYGTNVTFTANLGAVSGSYPTGSVVFLNGGTQIGTGTISSTGVATFATTNLPAGTDTISASYVGDNNFNASTTDNITETVAKANVPTDVLTTTNANPVFGTSITLTDTLGQVNSTSPTGTVTFYNGAIIIGTGTLTNGVATLTLNNLPGGTDPIKAVYGGDNTFNTANSNILNEIVSPLTGYSDVLSTSNATPSYGTSVTLTDTFPAVAGVYPTGLVTFSEGPLSLGTGTINASGVATLTTTNLPVGTYNVTASYGGDGNFASATSNPVLEKVSKATGYGNTLTTTNANPTYGTSITLTDTIASVNGVYPTGVVTFYNGAVAIGTGTLSPTGVATIATSALPAGTDTITASYPGDSTFAESVSTTVIENVTKANVAGNVLTTSNASPAFGGSVTLTDTLAPVNGTYPSGTITFLNNGVSIGTGVISATGVATLTTTGLPVGTDTITASFPGDATFNPSTSNPLTETVAKATGYSDVLTSSTLTPAFGASVTLTDTIAAVNGVYATGTVTFYNGGVSIGTGTLSATGVATLTTTNLPAGADTITAGYPGDNTFDKATSNPITETVAKATGYSDVLTTSNANPGFGSSVTLTDTIAAVNGVYPSGSVTFYSNGASIGTGTLSATGVATLTTTNLPAGTDNIKVDYLGDSTFDKGSSNVVVETVAKASGYGDVLTTTNANPTFGASITLTDTIAPVNGVYPTGSVTFYNGTTSIGTSPISAGGVATLTTSNLPVGTDTVTAGYLGDNTFAAATSNQVIETVAKVNVAGDVLTASTTSPSFGGSVTLTDTFAPLNGVYPTGTITFSNGGASIGTGTLNATGVATLTLSTLPTGPDSITASFPGDTTFAPATSNTVVVTVAKVQGSNTLATSNPSPVFGSSVTFTATLGTIGGVPPTGAVTFTSGGLLLGSGTVNNNVATVTTNVLPVGTDSVIATYNGDGNYTTSTSNIVKETVTQAALSSDVLAASPTSTSFGQSVTLTDTLTGINGVIPTGSVSFYNGSTLLSTVTVDGTGVATLNTTSLPVATNNLHATYSSDTNYAAATSNQVTVTVGKIAASNADTATGTGIFGAPNTQVSITIPFSGPSAPTGDITVNDTHGNTVTIKASTCTTSGTTLNCTATLPTLNDPAGPNTVTVSQASDADYAGNTGGGTITLGKAAATTGDSVTGTGTYGAATTSITVTVPYAGPVAPTGDITVTDALGNSVKIAESTCTVAAKTLTCPGILPTANEPVGANNATVFQAGDSNYAGSTGGGAITIGKAAATSTDSATGTGSYGAPTTTVTVKIPYAGVKAPTGDVTVTDTFGNTITVPSSACTSGGGVLTCTANLHTASEPLGTNSVNVSQAGDSNYSGSTGTGSITIGPAVASTGDTATGAGTYGAPTTTVTVKIPYAGANAPTGAITLSDTHNNTLTFPASTCTSTTGTQSCTVAFSTQSEPVGSNLVLISQAADNDYAGTSGSGAITIAKALVTNIDSANGTGVYGAPTTSVTVTIPYGGAAAPTGAVTVKDNLGNTVSIAGTSCAASGYALECIVNLPTANVPVGGNNPLTVSQVGDSNYSGSTGTGNLIIGKARATSTDTATGTGTYGDATTQVVVTIPFAGLMAPTGLITVKDSLNNVVVIAASTCVTSGGSLTCTASLPTSNVPTGTDAVTVSQASDANYAGSTGSGAVTINPAGSHGDDSATGSGSYGAPSTPITVVIPFSGAAPTGLISVADTLGNNISIPAANCKASATALVCAGILPTANEPVGSNPVTVGQAADANHAASTGSGAIMINPAAPTTGDSASGAGVYGAATTAVTVTIPYAGAAAPTGAITVSDNLGETVTGQASVCTAANQVLTCVLNLPTANEPLGANTVNVAQAADANYAGSTGSGRVTISTSPVSPVGSTASGVQNVTITQGTASTLLTATLAYGGAIPPSGAVTFTVAGGAPVTATCSTGASPETCTAMYPTDSLQIGTYTITANEAADPNYTAGSATGTLTVAAGSVSPILDSISYVGNVLIVAGTQSATLTANITYTGPVPTGALTFNLPGGTPVTATCTSGPSPLACTATYPTATLAPASYVITALEAADSNYPQGEATALLTVSPNASTPVSPILATGSYVNSVLVPYGTASATLYATIAFNGPPPTGTVSFTVIGGPGNVVQGVCTSGNAPMTCTADYPTATLGIGSYKIQVNVAADSNYPAGSAIGTLTITEVAASTNDSVTGSGNYGDPTSPITISIPYPGSIAPSGAITVTDSYNNTVTVQASTCTAAAGALSCPANLPTANVPVGTDAATVSQGPDTVYAPSTGKGSITIGKATATTTDSATGTGTFGAPTSSVTVTIPYSGATAPAGAITVSDSFGNTATIPAQSCTSASGVLTCNTNLATANEPLGSNPLTITQVGDVNYTGSTGNGSVTISKAGPSTGDTATGAGAYGAPSTPVTITIPFVGSTAPTGAITVTDTHNNTVTIQTSACTATTTTLTCAATLPTYSESVGPNTLTVSQAGDSNYTGSTGTGTVTLAKAPATTGDTATGTGYYGNPTTSVTVNIPYIGQAAPTGAVTITDTQNNTVTVPGSSCTSAAGVLTCTGNLPTANEPVGTNSVTVSQATDANYTGSTGAGTVTINKAQITTGDTATGTGTYGAPTTPITITIPYAGVQPPTGLITVSDTSGDTITIPASACTAANGVLTCAINFPTTGENVGTNPITISQAGDGNYSGSNNSGTVTSITINKPGAAADTATGTGTYGSATTPVTVTIPFVGATPTGAITLTDTHGNSITVTSCTAGTSALNCTANLPTVNEPVGANPLTVSQAADANHPASTGTGTLTITKAPATTTDAASGAGIYGAATSSVTVTIPFVGQAAPTGAITVADSFGGTATVAGSTCTAASNTLTCTLTLPTVNEPVGPNPLTVTQVGDANYIGSTGTGTMTISKAAAGADTATGTGTYGAATTAVTITIPYVGAGPTGSIVLADTHNNTVTIAASSCTATAGTLTCTTTLPTATDPVGANAVTVSQAADANHSGSTGGGTITINKAPATSADVVTGTGTYGSPTTTVTVTIPYIGSTAPTGAITVTDSFGNTVTVQASTCTAAAGVLTCSITLPTANEPLGSNPVTITQASDANYSGSTGSGNVTINKPGATTGDTVTGTGTYGAATTPVTVNIPYIGTTAPTGAITLTDTHGNTVTIQASACTAAKGVQTCTANLPTANEPTGSNTVTVNQAADAIFNGSTGSGAVTINKAAATAGDTVTGSGNYGAPTTSVTVSIPYAGATAPTGAITITDSVGNTITVPASSCTAADGVLTCTASLPTANEPVGANTITVAQAADANYSGSTGSGSVTIGKTKPTLTAPSITPLNGAFGTSVTITQTVPAGETGTVTFFNGTSSLGTATIANGVATLTTSALPVGADSITATANGDANYAAATSPAVTDNVSSTTTAIALISSQSALTPGSNVTFTATVSTPGTGTISGTVTFYDGTVAIGTGTVANGVASLSTTTLGIGSHSITAAFAPATGSTLSAATSTAVTETVTQAASSLALSSSQNPAIVGQSVTLTATAPASIAGVTPTGKVTFYDGTTAIGTGQLNASGVATLATTTLTGGSHNVTAVYAGDAVYATSTSPVVAQQISDYTVGNTTPAVGVDAGAAAAFNITIKPVGSIGFSAPVVLTVTGLPAKFTAAFAQGTLTPGSGGGATTMTVQTFAQALTAMEREHHIKSLEAAAAWACLFPLLGLRRVRRRLPKALLMFALMLGSFGVIAPLTGCGGGYFGPQPATYTLTVTGTSGTLQRSTTVTLNVR